MLYISSPDGLSQLFFGIAMLSHTEITDFQEVTGLFQVGCISFIEILPYAEF
jgi:hypothetical protein